MPFSNISLKILLLLKLNIKDSSLPEIILFAVNNILQIILKKRKKEKYLKNSFRIHRRKQIPIIKLCSSNSVKVDESWATTLGSADKARHLLKPNPLPTQEHGCPGPSPLLLSLNSFWESKYKIARHTNSICSLQDTWRAYVGRLRYEPASICHLPPSGW